ncbi:MAG: hypothetical protein EU529_14695 [Promethearchaeota archaeon]|nr:MAG: hypothetical protein EU529_14695 [Candidatus Lokiarchaeota archaeon]
MEVKPGDLNIWFGRYYSGSIDFTSYLILTIIFIILSIIFKYKYEEEAFWKIYLSSSVFWIIFELILQGTAWRTWYEQPTLFWSIKINYPITALLQGPMEGGIPTVLMYGFAKLLAFKRDKEFIILTIVFVILAPILLLTNISSQESATVSRRAVSLFSILFVSIFTIVGFIIALKFYEDVKYPLASFIFLAIIGSYINLVGWLIGVRPILIADTFEIGKEATGWHHAPISIAIMMCLWDGIIEISGIYFGFYMITTYFWAKDDLSIKFRE